LAIAASNGAGPAVARFSVGYYVTGSSAWVAALMMMALPTCSPRSYTCSGAGWRRPRRPRRPRPASRQPPPAPDTGSPRHGARATWFTPAAPDGGEACPGPGWRKRAGATTAGMPTVSKSLAIAPSSRHVRKFLRPLVRVRLDSTA
jgi:hypothetical protein